MKRKSFFLFSIPETHRAELLAAHWFLTLLVSPCPRTGRPVRCMLDRDEDMLITGGRHPFLAKYKVFWSFLFPRVAEAGGMDQG